jgi:hypothetical protein
VKRAGIDFWVKVDGEYALEKKDDIEAKRDRLGITSGRTASARSASTVMSKTEMPAGG